MEKHLNKQSGKYVENISISEKIAYGGGDTGK